MRKFRGASHYLLVAGTSMLALAPQIARAQMAPPSSTQLPTAGHVVAGQASIQQGGPAVMNIIQSSDRAAINWQAFDIGSAASVNFQQPSSQSVTLNRVLDANPSQIYGKLSSNGQVFLSNPNGVLFAPGSSVDVGGIVATTHGISDADFMAKNDRFIRSGATGSVLSLGQLKAAPGGYVALLAPEVRNEGVIIAQMGTVALASGEAVTLNFGPNSKLSSISVDPSQIKALVENRQAILVEGGQIILAASATDRLAGSVVNSGTLNATNMVDRGGVITIEAGNIQITDSSRIEAKGVTGGGSVFAGSGSQHAVNLMMAKGANIDVSATGMGNGGIVDLRTDLAATGALAAVHGSIVARGGAAGGNGGNVETSGALVDFTGVRVDTSAPLGATGEWLIDPYDLTVDSAAATTINTNLGTASVTLKTTSTGTTGPGTANAAGNGDIFINSALSWTSGNTLTLNAYRNVNINAPISASNNGKVTIVTGDTNGDGISDIGAVGDYSFGATKQGGIGNLTFGTSVGTAVLKIATGGGSILAPAVAVPYTLIYDTGIGANGLASLDGKTSGNYALANSIVGGTVYTALIPNFGDGNNHNVLLTGLGNAVTGLTLNVNAQSYNGLFGSLYGTVRDLGITGATLNLQSGVTDIGLLAGRVVGGTIKNTWVTGAFNTTAGAGNSIGGLVGELNNSTIANSYSTVNVTANYAANVGGLVGTVANSGLLATSTITNSYATGNVTTSSFYVGGLVGNMGSASGTPNTITNSYATGNVSGTGGVGGLVGTTSGTTKLTSTYAKGNVTGGNNNVGGLVGTADGTTITSSYANGNVTSTVASSTGYGGLVGNLSNYSTINTSFATGNVSTTGTTAMYLGGLVGSINGNGNAINDAYAQGNLTAGTGAGYIGGLIGGTGNVAFTVTNAYFSGTMPTANAANSVAAVAGAGGTGTYKNVYWDSTKAGTVGYGGAPSVTGGGALTTAQLQNGSMPTGFNTTATSNGSPWSVLSGFYPYFGYQYPGGVQAISGTAYGSNGAVLSNATINLYVGGSLISGGTRVTDASGLYTALVGLNTITATSKFGGTLTLSGGSTVVGATYTDAPMIVSGNVAGFDLRQGVLLATTSETTNSALQSSLNGAFGSANYTSITSALAGAWWQYNASSDFSVDSALSHAGSTGLKAGGNLAINAALTATSSTLALQATGTITDGASGSITATNLVLLGGDVTLDAATNNVTTLAANGVKSLSFTDSNALTVGSVGPYNSGISATTINGTATTTSGISAAGNITLAATAGNLIVANNISTTAAALDSTLTLKSADNLTLNSGVTIGTASVNKLNTVLWSNTDGTGQGNITLTNNTITTKGGHVWMGGGAQSGTLWNGLTVGDGYATGTTIGDQQSGITLGGSTVNTGVGNISLAGKYAAASAPTAGNSNFGIKILNSSLTTTTGSVSIDGQISGLINMGAGTFLSANAGNAAITTGSGAISLKGTGSDSVGTSTGTRQGLSLLAATAGNSVSVQSTSGSILVDGQANFANNGTAISTGLQILAQTATSPVTINSNSGDVTIRGVLSSDNINTAHNSLLFNAADAPGNITIGSTGATGAITILGDAISQQFDTAAVGTIAVLGTGAVTVAPTGTSFTGLRKGATTLNFGDYWNFGTTHNALTFGSATNVFDLSLAGTSAAGLTAAGPINVLGGQISTLKLNATGVNGTVTLKSNNNKAITIGGAVKALGLQVLGASAFSATDTSNDVTSFAASGVGNLNYIDSNALTIGTVGATNGISASGTVSVASRVGNLTLAQSVVTTNASNAAITLNAGLSSGASDATGGNLIVTGSPAVTTGVGGRATLYSGSTSETSLGSLVNTGPGRFRYNSDEGTANFSTVLDTGIYGIYREKISIAAGSASTVYGTAPQYTSNAANGDAVNFSVTSPVLSTSNNLTVGNYTVAIGNLAALAGLGYTTTGTTSGSLTVTQKSVTIASGSASKTYDGTNSLSGATVGLSGLIAGDVVTGSGSGTYGQKNAGTNLTYTLNGLSLSGADAANYVLASGNSYSGNNGVIAQALLTINAVSDDRVYNGNASSAGTVTYSGLVGSDTLSGLVQSFDSKNAGARTLTVGSGYVLSDGNGGGNYSITTNTASGNIAQKSVTIASGLASKTYDGTNSLSGATVGLSGLIVGDVVTGSGSGTYGQKNAGNNLTYTLNGLSLSGADAANYVLASGNSYSGNNGVIAQALLTINAVSDDRVYNGNASSAGIVTYSGLVGSDTLSGLVQSFDSKNVGSRTLTVGSGYVLSDGNGGGNYSITTNTATGNIAQKSVTIASGSASKTYDGTNSLSGATVGLSGLISGDVVTGSGSGTYGQKNAGTNLTYTLNGLSLSGADAANYVLASGNSYSGNNGVIAQAVLTINAVGSSKTYDGNASSTGTVTYSGLVGSDTLSGLSQSFDSKNAGARTLTVGSGYVLSDGNGGGNYSVTTNTATGNIAQKSVTITSGSASKTYDGTNSLSGATVGLSGLIAGDVVTGSGSGTYGQKNAGTNLTYTLNGLSLSGADAANYVLASGNSYSGNNGVIAQALLTINAVGSSKTYDGNASSAGIVTYSGLVGGDTLSGLVQSFDSKNVGTRTLAVDSGYVLSDGNGGGNYSITRNTASGNISKAMLTINAVSDDRVYNGNASSAGTVTYSGLVGGDTLSGLVQSFDSKNVGSRTLAVDSGYVLSDGNGGGNYSITRNTASGNISKAMLTINAVGDDRVYNGNASSAGIVTYSGLVGGDTLSGLVQSFDSKNAGTRTLAVDSGYVLSDGNGGGNYSITRNTASGNISKAMLTINAVGSSKTYDGNASSTGTVTYSGLVDGDTLSGLSQSFDSKNAGSRTLAVDSGYVLSDGNGGGNYSITRNTASGNISKAMLTINAVGDDRVYNGNASSAGIVTYSGLVGGDTLSGLVQSFDSKNVGSRTLAVDSGYVLSDGNGGGNYSITRNTASGNISKAMLTINAVGDDRVYNGNASSAGIVTYSGLVGGDTLSGLVQSFDSKNVGSRTLAVDSGYVLSDGNGGGNYSITRNTASGNISKAMLTINAVGDDRVYNGNASSAGTVTYSGLVGGDTLSGLVQSFDSKNVGSRTLAVDSGYVLSDGNGGGNYSITRNTASGNISKAMLTINAVGDDRVYNGNASSAGTVTYSGLVGGDTLSGLVQSFDSKNAGARTLAVDSGYVLSDGNGGGNYSITRNTASGNISKAMLTINAVGDDRVYNGNASSAGTVTYSGLVGGDTLSGLVQSFDSKNVGSRTLAVDSGYVLSDGNGGGNYSITRNTASGNISKAMLTINAVGDDRVYNGNASSTGTVTYSGLVGGDTLSGLVQSFDSKNAGARTLTVGSGYVLSDGNGGGNYSVTTNTATGNIAQKSVTITSGSASKTYDGTNSLSGATVGLSGLITGDLVTGSGSGTYGQKNAGNNLTYTLNGLSLSGADAANYVLASGNSYSGNNGVIAQAVLTINAVGSSKTYDGNASSAGTVTYSGLVGSDTLSGLSQSFDSKNAGARTLTVGSGYVLSDGNGGGNYSVTTNTATGNIAQALVTITSGLASKTYDGTNSLSGATVGLSGLISGDVVTGSGSGTYGQKNAGTNLTYTLNGLSLSGADAANYVLASGNSYSGNNGVIAQAVLTINAVGSSKTYDGNASSTGTVTYSGLVDGDTLSGLSQSFDSKNVGSRTLTVGSGYVLSDGNNGGNYSITTKTASGNIAQKSVTIASGSASKTYDGTNSLSGATVDLSGLITGDLVTGSGSGTYGQKNAGNNLSYTLNGLSLSGADAANYVLASGNSYSGNNGVIAQAVLTINAVGSSKTYDGNASSTGTVTYSGLVGSDTLSGLSQSFDSKNAGARTLTVGSGYVLSDGNGGGNYSVTTNTATGNIAQKSVTITSGLASKTYDGTNSLSGATVGLSGLIAGDVVTGSGSGTYGQKNAGTNLTYTLNGLSLSGADAANYVLASGNSYSGNNGVIAQALLTINAVGSSKTYDGNASSAGTVTYSGLVGSDTLSGLSQSFDSKNAGARTLTVGSGYVLSDGNGGGNYSVTTNTATGNIAQALVTITSGLASKTYDGTNSLSGATVGLSGLISGDVVTGSGSGTYGQKNAGTNLTYTLNGLSLSGADAANYVLASGNSYSGNNGVIAQALLTINAVGSSKTYDGNASSTGTVTYSGLVGSDTLSGLSQSFDSKNAGTRTLTVGSGYVLSDGNGGGNYSVTTNTATGNIAQKSVTITSGLASKTYDGTNSLSGATVGLSGLITGDVVTGSGSGTYGQKNAGTNLTYTLNGLSLSGADAANYVLASGNSYSGNNGVIAQAVLTINAVGSSKTYDGNASSTGTVTYSGLVDGDTLSGLSQSFDSKNVGSRTLTVGSGYVLSDGNNGGNYSITTKTASGNIAQKSVTIASGSASKTYDGTNSLSGATVGLSGLIAGDVVTGSGSGTYGQKNAGTNLSYTLNGLSLSGADAANYVLASGNSYSGNNGVIAQALLTINAVGSSKTYDGNASSTGTVTYSGLVGSDTLSGLSQSFDSKNAGTRTLTVGSGYVLSDGNGGGNYSVTTNTATGNIAQKSVTITSGLASKTYDGTNSLSGATVGLSGLIAGDLVTGSGSGTYGQKNAGTNLTYTLNGLSLSGADAANYVLASGNSYSGNNGVIAQALLTINAVGSSKTYDGNASSTGTVTYSGLVGSDTLSGLSQSFDSKNAGTRTLTVGSGYVLSDGNGGGNYSVTTNTATGNIAQKSVTITSGLASKTYDGTNSLSGATVDLSGLITGDVVTGSGSGTYGQKNAGTNLTYTLNGLSLSGADAANYVLASGNSYSGNNGVIAQALLTINAVGSSKTYDGNASSTGTVTYSGLVGSDTLSGLSQSFDSKNAGARTLTVGSGYVLSDGNGGGNYSVTTNTATGNIAQKSVTITSGLASKTYDGTNSLSGATVGLSGLIAGDVVTGSGSGTYGQKNAGTNLSYTLNGLSLSGADAANYVLASGNSYSGNNGVIAQALLTINAVGSSKTYDGNASSAGTVTYSGLVGSDTLSGLSQSFDSKNAGSRTLTVGSGYVLSDGNGGGNYSITTNTATGNIDRASLSVGGSGSVGDITGINRVYDGTTAVGVDSSRVTYTGLVAGDNITVTGMMTDKNAGNGKLVNLIFGGDASNYGIVGQSSTIADIARKALSVSNAVAQNKTDDGTDIAVISGAILTTGGVVAGDSITLGNATSGKFNDATVGTAKPVSTAMTLGGGDASNYVLAQPSGLTADITPAGQSGPSDQPGGMPPTDGTPPVVVVPPIDNLPPMTGTPTQPSGPGGTPGAPDNSGGGNGGNANNVIGSLTILSSLADAQANGGGFVSVLNFEPQKLQSGSAFSYRFPKTTFTHSDPNAVLSYTAQLANGDPLPEWLHFDAAEVRLYGVAPKNTGAIKIVVVAHDGSNHQAQVELTLEVGS